MREMTVNLTLRFTHRTIRWALTCLFMTGLAGNLSSESVTMTTYYPAPSGVYTNMITTNNTYLARDAGTVVIRTSTVDPAYALDVNGALRSGTLTVNGNVSATGNISATNITATGNISATGVVTNAVYN